MLQRLLASRLFVALTVLIMVGVFASQFVGFDAPRPRGSIEEDLARLAERDDVNVLFILIDTLRADRLGSYGYERDTSPTLDRLAAHGIRFDRHVAQSSWTKSSMASLWTSFYPAGTGVHRYMHAVPAEATLPAEVFRDAGYRTVGIWRNGWVAPNFGFSQGFDVYQRPTPAPFPPAIRREHPGATVPGSDLDATEATIEFLRTTSESDRWFLYLHLMDVHQYTSDMESARFGTTYSDLYDNAIHWTDRNIERILDELERRDQLRRTIVVVAADHGEAFREHEFEGHARNLYGEVIQTPLIISLPFRLSEGVVVREPSANVDLWPTVFDLIGLPGIDGADGQSLVAAIEAAANGGTTGADRAIIADLDTGWGNPKARSNRILTVTRGSLRAHELRDQGFELYDLAEDPGEQIDLSETRPEERERLAADLSAYEEGEGSKWSTDEVELDEMMLNQLRALGYKIE